MDTKEELEILKDAWHNCDDKPDFFVGMIERLHQQGYKIASKLTQPQQTDKIEYWKGFDYALNLLDDMYAKSHPHKYNIADCIKAKVNRLENSKIRENTQPQQTVSDEDIRKVFDEENRIFFNKLSDYEKKHSIRDEDGNIVEKAFMPHSGYHFSMSYDALFSTIRRIMSKSQTNDGELIELIVEVLYKHFDKSESKCLLVANEILEKTKQL